jgi:SAM-dependent methyltransferase
MNRIGSEDYHDYIIKDGRFIGEFEQMYQNVEDPWGMKMNKGLYSLTNDVLMATIGNLNSSARIGTVLHAGCALGLLTSRVRQTLGDEVRIWGCDISETAIRHAKAKHKDVDFFTHDLSQVEQLPFEPGFFDLILMVETMWYVLPWLHKIFRHFHAILRPGGTLLVKQYFLQHGEQTYGNDLIQTPKDLARFMVEAGFSMKHDLHLDKASNHTYLAVAQT